MSTYHIVFRFTHPRIAPVPIALTHRIETDHVPCIAADNKSVTLNYVDTGRTVTTLHYQFGVLAVCNYHPTTDKCSDLLEQFNQREKEKADRAIARASEESLHRHRPRLHGAGAHDESRRNVGRRVCRLAGGQEPQ